ncbi:glutamate racemase [bacterium]
MNNPIGIFDSGLGGLTVMREIAKVMPNENIVYFGDTARVPYGPKSKETIIRFSIEIANFLMKQKIKMLIVACNTASSYAIKELRKQIDIPVVGVIEPGAIAAHKKSEIRRVGVIGTEGTIGSKAYDFVLKKIDSRLKIYSQACPLFVPLAEHGWTNNHVAKLVSETYLKSLQQKNIDTLILGCTHYPLLKSVIRKTIDTNIKIVDSAIETAKLTRNILAENNLISKSKIASKYKFFVSDDPQKFSKLGSKFLKKQILQTNKILFD